MAEGMGLGVDDEMGEEGWSDSVDDGGYSDIGTGFDEGHATGPSGAMSQSEMGTGLAESYGGQTVGGLGFGEYGALGPDDMGAGYEGLLGFVADVLGFQPTFSEAQQAAIGQLNNADMTAIQEAIGSMTSEAISGLTGKLGGNLGAKLGLMAAGPLGGMVAGKAVGEFFSSQAKQALTEDAIMGLLESKGIDPAAMGFTSTDFSSQQSTDQSSADGLIMSQLGKRGGNMGFTDSITGKGAAEAGQGAARTDAGWQQRGLEYLIEGDAVPRQFREQALQMRAGALGMEGGTGSQQELIDRARNSPLYNEIMGGQQAGEESIMRNAAATGGLRSGNVQANLADYNTRLQNQALTQSYGNQMGELQGLSRLPSNASAIALGYGGIGSTLAGGQLASARAREAGNAQMMNLAGSAYQEMGGMSGIGSGISSGFDWAGDATGWW